MTALIGIALFLALGYYIFRRLEDTNKGPFFEEDNRNED